MRQLKITQLLTTRSSITERYLSEVSKQKLITQQEEVELTKRIKRGDKEALKELVSANLRFVISVSKQYQNRGLSLDDLINEGNLGLIKAATRFDDTKGFKFISFAVWWIRQSILEAIANNGKMIRIPQNKIAIINKFNNSFNELEQKLGRIPDEREIIEFMKISKKEYKTIINSSLKHMSYDLKASDEKSGDSLVELLENKDTVSPDESLNKESLKSDMHKLLNCLTERERDILKMFFGLKGEACSLYYIGTKFNLSQERVRQIKEKALRKLRKRREIILLKKHI